MDNLRTKRGGTLAIITIAFRNIWRNPRRTAFCVVAVGIAVFFIIFYSSFIDGFTNSINGVLQVFDVGHVKAVSAEYEAESEYMPVQYPLAGGRDAGELAAEVEKIPGVRGAFPRIQAYATLQESVVKHAILWGIDAKAEAAAHDFNLTDRSDGLLEGRWPAPDSNECAVGRAFAEKTGLKIGDKVPLKTVSAQFSDKMWAPVITGVFSFDYNIYDQETLIVDFGRLQRLLVLEGGTQQLVVYAGDERDSARIEAAMKALLGDGAVVRRWQDNYWVVMMKALTPLYTLIYLVFLVMACFLIINTVVMIVNERIKEIGMMGSLGMTRGEIVEVFFFESLFLAMFGAFAGVFLGGLLTALIQNYPLRWGDLTGNTFSSFPANNALFLKFDPANLFQGWLMGVVVASIFTLIPSLKSAFVEPVEALRR